MSGTTLRWSHVGPRHRSVSPVRGADCHPREGGRRIDELDGRDGAAHGCRGRGGGSWLTFALASALFAALTSILGKVGISGVDPTLGTAVRTLVVLAMAWVIVGAQGRMGEVQSIPGRELAFIVASGAATCASWLAYYHALKDGPASVVVPIDKLSILVTVAVSAVAFHERFTRHYLLGLALMCAGTVAMVVA